MSPRPSATQAPELKHKNLAKRPSGQERIANLVSALKDTTKCTVYLCHKEFTLLTYLVDLWVEPAMHLDGIDLYRDGANLGLCNMAFFCLRSYQGDRFLTEHLRRFQRMMVSRTPESYRDFWSELARDFDRADKRTRDILLFFLGAELRLGPPALLKMPERALDPVFTTALQTYAHWRQQTESPIKLIHDNSSSLAKDKPLWDLMTSSDIENRIIGIPGRELRYPLNVVETEFADSGRAATESPRSREVFRRRGEVRQGEGEESVQGRRRSQAATKAEQARGAKDSHAKRYGKVEAPPRARRLRPVTVTRRFRQD